MSSASLLTCHRHEAEISALTRKLDVATEAANINADTVNRQRREYDVQRQQLFDEIRGLKKAVAEIIAQRDKYLAQVRLLQDSIGTLTRAKETLDHLGRDRFDIEKNEDWGND